MKIFLPLALLLLTVLNPVSQQPVINARRARVLELEGLQFKDLNKNGRLDVYED
jgi:beta-glucosidase